jgi:hypothetical protein
MLLPGCGNRIKKVELGLDAQLAQGVDSVSTLYEMRHKACFYMRNGVRWLGTGVFDDQLLFLF